MISKKNFIYFFYVALLIGTGIGYGPVYLFHFSLILLLFVPLRNKSTQSNDQVKKYSKYLIFFFLWYFFSFMWSYESNYSLTYSVYILIGISIVFLSLKWIRTEEMLKKVLKVITYVIILEIIICLLEIFTPFRLPSSPYSEYAYLFGRKQTDFNLFEVDTVLYINTVPTGFYANPNQLAIFFAMVSPFVFFMEWSKKKFLLLSSIVLILIFTNSRGVLISFLLGIFIYLFMTIPFRKILLLLLPVIFLYGIFVSSIESLKQSTNPRIADIGYLGETLNEYLFEESVETGSISYRKELINNGLEAFYDTNGLGVGGGASIKVQEANPVGFNNLTSMHNFWIELLVEGGIIIFISFLIWYLSLAFKLYKTFLFLPDGNLKNIGGALFICFIVFSIGCVSASSVIYFLPMWLMFGLSLSFLSVVNKRV